MREFEIIANLSSRSPTPSGVRLGIGDDAAVLEPGAFDLIALDTMVEGIHFRADFSTPQDIGWKLLACNLSDIAAMGGAPGAYLLAFSLGTGAGEAFVEGVVEGLEAAARTLAPGFGVAPIGGDTTRSPGPTVLSLTLFGRSDPRSGPVVRSGARSGDSIGVVGHLGAAAAGLEALLGEVSDEPTWHPLLQAHRRPHAQVKAGLHIGQAGLARAMIDVSDGFAQDLGHILRQSNLGALVQTHHLPAPPEVGALAAHLQLDQMPWILSGGDDYALILTADPDDWPALEHLAASEGFEITRVGRCLPVEQGVQLVDAKGAQVSLPHTGYEHTFEGRGQ